MKNIKIYLKKMKILQFCDIIITDDTTWLCGGWQGQMI